MPRLPGFVRFQALEQLYRGKTQEEVAQLSDRSLRTIECWAKSFNASGLYGLVLKGYAGRPRRIDAQKLKAEYIPILLEPERAKESH